MKQMKHRYVIMVVLAGLLQMACLAESETTARPNANTKTYSFDNYRVISQRNVFSKNRRPPRQETDRPPRQTRRRSVVISLYVLKGIAENGPQKIALIENEISGEFTQATVGTPIENGTIKDIKMDHVVYEEDGESRKLIIGDVFSRNETQVEVSADEEEAPPTGDETSPATESGQEGSADENDILKKLLERRRNQVGS